jgi:hypothetical protein
VKQPFINSCWSGWGIVRTLTSLPPPPSSHLSAVFTFGEVITSKEILRQRAFADLFAANLLGKLSKRRYSLPPFTAPFDTGKLRTLFNNVFYSMESRSQRASSAFSIP